jgi:UDP-glucose 4-epimerase
MGGNSALTYLVTGGAGFIGSHLIDALLSDPTTREVRILDNFSSGRREHLAHHKRNSRLKIHKLDLLDLKKAVPHLCGVDQVFHLAANPDARWGLDNTRLDLEQETIVTYHVLEAMRRHRVSQIVFSSSGTVYGDVGTTVTHEGLGPCLPVSLYGAGKVASEALITAFCGSFGLRSVILRFGNIVGERTTHGVIYDFIRQLAKNSRKLKVLGNGYQAKPYVYVRDLVDALLFGAKRCTELGDSKFDVFNVAPDGATSVRFIVNELINQLGFKNRTKVQYGDTVHHRMAGSAWRGPRRSGTATRRSARETEGATGGQALRFLGARAADFKAFPVLQEILAVLFPTNFRV